jgi:hypothetical protein
VKKPAATLAAAATTTEDKAALSWAGLVTAAGAAVRPWRPSLACRMGRRGAGGLGRRRGPGGGADPPAGRAGVIAALWARASGWLAAAGAVVAAVAVAWWAGRRAGTTSARTRALEAEIRTRETRDAVERDVARVPDAAGQLRERWSRD